MKIRGVIFNIDDVLYDTTFQKDSARISAIKAMIEAGLPVDLENGFRVLKDVIAEHGTDYPKQFDKMLEKLGINHNARVIAAGVVAYRETSRAYLQPYPDTIPTIVKLRDVGCKVAAISGGDPVKQWQKLINLGAQHLFHKVLMAREIGGKEVDQAVFEALLQDLKTSVAETLFVGNKINQDFIAADKMKMTTVRIRRGMSRTEEVEARKVSPVYEIETLSELFEIIEG